MKASRISTYLARLLVSDNAKASIRQVFRLKDKLLQEKKTCRINGQIAKLLRRVHAY